VYVWRQLANAFITKYSSRVLINVLVNFRLDSNYSHVMLLLFAILVLLAVLSYPMSFFDFCLFSVPLQVRCETIRNLICTPVHCYCAALLLRLMDILMLSKMCFI